MQVMFDKAPTGIWNLRPDSLALLLSLANVAAHSRCLLLENCQGLLAAACAERMGGLGALCCVGTGGKTPGMSGLRQLNLDQQGRSIVCCTQLADLQAAAQVRRNHMCLLHMVCEHSSVKCVAMYFACCFVDAGGCLANVFPVSR